MYINMYLSNFDIVDEKVHFPGHDSEKVHSSDMITEPRITSAQNHIFKVNVLTFSGMEYLCTVRIMSFLQNYLHMI